MTSWSHQLWSNPRWDPDHHPRFLEVGVRVVGAATSSRRPYVGTVVAIRNHIAEVFFDSGNWRRELPLASLQPVASWSNYIFPNPPLAPLRRPLALELRENGSLEYDARTLETVWLMLNNRVFYARLPPPRFAWLQGSNRFGLYDPVNNTFGLNRARLPTVRAAAAALASFVCEQAVATLGPHAPPLWALRAVLVERTGLQISGGEPPLPPRADSIVLVEAD